MSKKSTKFTTFRLRRNVYGYILAGFSFLVLTLLTIKIFVPEISTSATSQTAEQTVGPYKMSMSNDSAATINITPTSSQAVYTTTNSISVTNDCTAGATITMTTNSTTSNSLTRTAVNSDNLAKEIIATTTSGLDNNSWGWSKDNGTTFAAVPKKGQTAATVYDEEQARTSAYTVPVMFGVKTNNEMPSGAYTNDVVYTMTPKQGCLTYSITWEMNGGTKKSGAAYPTSLGWGEKIDLSTLTPTRDGYTFTGWSDGSSNYTGISDINLTNKKVVNLMAQWADVCASGTTKNLINLSVNGVKEYDYSGIGQCAVLTKAGYYKLEVWGAQGGNTASIKHTDDSVGPSYRGGYGGYSIGIKQAYYNDPLYVYVGQAGVGATEQRQTLASRYNGGGGVTGASGTTNHMTATGGGATHIATISGVLSTLSSYKDTAGTNISKELLIVAGGGGGGRDQANHQKEARWGYGGSGGGFTSSGSFSTNGTITITQVSTCLATQTTGYSFGQGETTFANSGGGGGWYGGYGGSGPAYSGTCATYLGTGSGGSGYIGSSNLISGGGITKHMTCYSCATSTAVATRTNSNTNVSATATADYSKTGNGYARITYLGTSI